LNYLFLIMIIFQISWGINYQHNPLQDFDDQYSEADSSLLFSHFQNQTDKINLLRGTFDQFPHKNNIREEILNDFVKTELIFADLGLLKPSPGSIKFLYPGTFLNFNSAGMYFPFTGECLVDFGLHSLQL